ncbi:phytanoyl-CoA dioxygenase family protein [Aurantiacibacter flavus]|uniref:Phytanoyl-CoA dioxygenase family protein n=1 Tax=Aurantiacibacter flavus TaxID=3145232 RepID=A0ABV0CZH9_9SPHN
MSDATGSSDTKSAALFPGVPLIESPIFDNEDLPGFTEKERQLARQLNSDGFAVLDFPDPDIDARIERIKRNLGPGFGIPLEDPAADKTKGERRVQDAWQTDADVHAIASNPAILDLLSKLYGRRAFPFQTLNFPVGTQQAAHADSVHFSSLPERFMCGVWLAMEDITAEAGPLFYVRGSHRWPIVSNAMIGRRGYGSELGSAQAPYSDAWAAMCKAHGKVEEPFLARKGQALIWCANLLHGGSRQSDPKLTRWSQVTHYFFDDCIYYTPAFSDESLGRLALRDLVSVEDRQPKPNTYLGETIGNAPTAKTNMVSRLLGNRSKKRKASKD